MSLNLSQFPTVPFNQGDSGPIAATPIVLCTPPTDDPKQIPVHINWNDYATQLAATPDLGVVVNLFAGVQGAVKQIRGVYIDNSLSTAAIYVKFPGTNFTVFAPPGYLVMLPVITNLPNAVIYILNADTKNLPETNIIFSNIEFRPVYIPSPTAATSNVLPTISYRGSVNATTTAGAVQKTFNNVPLGPVESDRLSVFIVSWTDNLGVTSQLTSCVVNGVNLGAPFIQVSAAGSGGTGGGGCALFYTRVPTPFITATVVCNFSANANAAVCSAYMINGQDSDTPIDYSFAGAAVGSNSALSISVGMQQYAVSCYGATTVPGGVTPTLTNSFIDASGQLPAGAGNPFWGVSHYDTPIDQIRTVGNTGSALLGAAWF